MSKKALKFILNSLRKNKGWDFSGHLEDRAFDWGYDPDEVEIALFSGLLREIKILHYPYRKDEMDIVAYTYPALKEGFSNWSSEIRKIFEAENPDEKIVKDWQTAGRPDTPKELKEWVYQKVEELPRESLNQLVNLAAELTGDLRSLPDVTSPLMELFKIPLKDEESLIELLQDNGLYIWTCSEPEYDFITPFSNLKLVCEAARLAKDHALAEDLACEVLNGQPFPLGRLKEGCPEEKATIIKRILETLLYDGMLVVEEENEDFWGIIVSIPEN